MTQPSKMTPSKNAVPFAKGVILPTPIVQKIERGMRDLAVNYGLRNRLRWLHADETFAVYVVDEGVTAPILKLIESGDAPKPLLTIQNKSIGGWNKFLPQVAAMIVKKYGQSETKQRRTA